MSWSAGKGDVRKSRRSYLVALLLAGLLMGCSPQALTTQRITVVLRYDDYSAKSALDLEAQLLDVFRQAGLTLTVGVIPYVSAGEMSDPAPQQLLPLNAEKGALLRDALRAGVIEIGLHGYSHQTHDARRMSEFAGLDMVSQKERLARGKALLETLTGTPVTLFIPPWNTYDLNTLQALHALGFTTLSAEMRGVVSSDLALVYVPFTCYPRGLRGAIEAARTSGDPAPVVVVLFHAYDFTEVNPYRGLVSYAELTELLAWLQEQEDVHVRSVGQAVEALGDLDAARAALNRASLAWSDLLIPPLQVQVAEETFLASNSALRLRAQARAGSIYLALLTLSALAGLLFGRFLPLGQRLWTGVLASVSLVALLAVAYAARDLRLYWRGAAVATLAVGVCGGLWWAYLRRRRSGVLERKRG